MPYRSLMGAVALTVLSMSIGHAKTADGATYPDWKGQWTRFVGPRSSRPAVARSDQTPGELASRRPSSQTMQRFWRTSIADQANGGFRQFPDRLVLAGRHAAHDDGIRA